MNQPAPQAAPPSCPSPRQKRVDRFMNAANIGTIAVIVAPLFWFVLEYGFSGWDEGDDLLVPVLIMLALFALVCFETYAVIYMFLRRKTGEFTQALWNSATTFAFFGAIAWLLIGPWVELSFAGLALFAQIIPFARDYEPDAGTVLAIMAVIFHAAIYVCRIRNGAFAGQT